MSPLLRVVIPHRGVDGKTVTERRKATFCSIIQLQASAAAALGRWPHYLREWGPTIVTSASLRIRIFNGGHIGAATIDVLREELGRILYSPIAEVVHEVSHHVDAGDCRLEVTIVAMKVDAVENPADRASRLAREHVPDPVVAVNELEGERTFDKGELVAVTVGSDVCGVIIHPMPWELVPGECAPQPPPRDPMDEYLDALFKPDPDPNRVTPGMLKPEFTIEPGGSRNKGNKKDVPMPTGPQMITTFVQRVNKDG